MAQKQRLNEPKLAVAHARHSATARQHADAHPQEGLPRSAPNHMSAPEVLNLQRTIGNQAVMRMIKSGAISRAKFADAGTIRRMFRVPTPAIMSNQERENLIDAVIDALTTDDGYHMYEDSTEAVNQLQNNTNINTKPTHTIVFDRDLLYFGGRIADELISRGWGNLSSNHRAAGGKTESGRNIDVQMTGIRGIVKRNGNITEEAINWLIIDELRLDTTCDPYDASAARTFRIPRIHWVPVDR